MGMAASGWYTVPVVKWRGVSASGDCGSVESGVVIGRLFKLPSIAVTGVVNSSMGRCCLIVA